MHIGYRTKAAFTWVLRKSERFMPANYKFNHGICAPDGKKTIEIWPNIADYSYPQLRRKELKPGPGVGRKGAWNKVVFDYQTSSSIGGNSHVLAKTGHV